MEARVAGAFAPGFGPGPALTSPLIKMGSGDSLSPATPAEKGSVTCTPVSNLSRAFSAVNLEGENKSPPAPAVPTRSSPERPSPNTVLNWTDAQVQDTQTIEVSPSPPPNTGTVEETMQYSPATQRMLRQPTLRLGETDHENGAEEPVPAPEPVEAKEPAAPQAPAETPKETPHQELKTPKSDKSDTSDTAKKDRSSDSNKRANHGSTKPSSGKDMYTDGTYWKNL